MVAVFSVPETNLADDRHYIRIDPTAAATVVSWDLSSDATQEQYFGTGIKAATWGEL